MLDTEDNFNQERDIQKTMLRLVRLSGKKKSIGNTRLGARLFLDLANISTRLKMYPLAMKWYNRAIRLNQKKVKQTFTDQNAPDSTGLYPGLQIDSQEINKFIVEERIESLPIPLGDIQCSFEDSKKAVAYAIIIHVKQPLPGRRKAFSRISNVGHTFITLIKFNEDNSSVSKSFGFYPAKKHFLSATPVHPGDVAVLKDDALHPWDETIGKFISAKKFDRILSNLESFSRTPYNLNKNNCTDFGLSEAAIAGIYITETKGRWPLGKGNNPANAGQSLLEKKFENEDAEYPETLLVNAGQGLQINHAD